MNYAVIEQVNGSFLISTEHGDNLNAAVIAWHNLCAALRNESSAVEAVVKVVDSNLDLVDGFVEFISHPAK